MDILLEYIVEAQEGGGRWVPIGKTGPNSTEFQATKLKNKGQYKFRVKAKTKEGESEPLTTEFVTTIKDPWDEPGKPGKPQVVDWDADRIDIEWTPPTNDGGAPIEGYIVEQKDAHTGEWKKVMETPDTNASIKGLKEGEMYQFRVKAVNKAGPGQPSDPSDRQVAKPRFGKFIFLTIQEYYSNTCLISVKAWLDLKACEHLTVKAGQTAKFDVKVGGEPFPDAFWYRGDEQLSTGQNIAIETKKDVSTVLYVKACKRSDGGDYKLLVRNKMGEQAGTVHLTVLGKFIDRFLEDH